MKREREREKEREQERERERKRESKREREKEREKKESWPPRQQKKLQNERKCNLFLWAACLAFASHASRIFTKNDCEEEASGELGGG
jgi:hypothetical protein